MDTILLIDNNAAILENFKEYFEIEGFTILVANKGSTGIEMANECMPNLIISEIIMYEMDGYEILRLLSGKDNTSGIPFIFSTTKSEKVDKIKALDLGADDYIVKPFCMELLSEMARKWIRSGSKRLLPLLVA